jgi:molybdenum cofactor biosynthesis enzyme MoaA
MFGKPLLTLVASTHCNLRCRYCTPTGEAHDCGRGTLDARLFRMAVEAATRVGIRAFRLTGGEPTLLPHFAELVRCLAEARSAGSYVTMNTNGVLWEKLLDALRDHPLDLVRVSLDAPDEQGFVEMAGRRGFGEVMRGIREGLARGIRIQVNMVVTRRNDDRIEEMIELCRSLGADLKLLDYEKQEQTPFGALSWRSEFVDLRPLRKRLAERYESLGLFRTTGGFGMPMEVFRVPPVTVRVKDSTLGSTYQATCAAHCPLYPCPEGVFSPLVRPDGTITWCRRRQELARPLGETPEEIERSIRHVLADMADSRPVWRARLRPEDFAEGALTRDLPAGDALTFKGLPELPR